MRKHLMIGPTLVLLGGINLHGQTELGDSRVMGVLQTDEGVPLGGVKVAYSRVVEFVRVERGGVTRLEEAPGEIRVGGSVLSGADGGFEIGYLPPGDYKLCVRGLPGFLDPCLWTAGMIDLPDVRAGERRDAGVITLKKGAALSVRVNDPQGILPGPETAISDGGLIVGVQLEDGTFHRLDVGMQDSRGRDMLMTVPSETPLRLWVFSRVASVEDGNGNVISENGSGLPFQLPMGTIESQIVLNITGKR